MCSDVAASSTHEDPYQRFLRARRDRVFHCQSYPGNAGDWLIQAGTELLLKRLGIQQVDDPARAEVLLIPGGNPAMWPGSGAHLWRQLWRRFPQAEFVVGPAGFRRQYPEWRVAIRTAGERVSGLFARDPVSYEALCAARLPGQIEIGLSHDPALQLRGSEWLAAQQANTRNDYALFAFRDDHEGNVHGVGFLEALRGGLPSRVFRALSRALTTVARWEKTRAARRRASQDMAIQICDASREDVEGFTRAIRHAAEVHTDRLHVMLLAAMLGKPVVAYGTSHNKLETVYHHSLRGWATVATSADDQRSA